VAWTFRCECGTESGYLIGPKPDPQRRPWPPEDPCGGCGVAVDAINGGWVECKALVTLTGAIGDHREIPEHFNLSLGRVVSGRKHLEYLQKKLGVSDYSPASYKGPPTDWDSKP